MLYWYSNDDLLVFQKETKMLLAQMKSDLNKLAQQIEKLDKVIAQDPQNAAETLHSQYNNLCEQYEDLDDEITNLEENSN